MTGKEKFCQKYPEYKHTKNINRLSKCIAYDHGSICKCDYCTYNLKATCVDGRTTCRAGIEKYLKSEVEK